MRRPPIAVNEIPVPGCRTTRARAAFVIAAMTLFLTSAGDAPAKALSLERTDVGADRLRESVDWAPADLPGGDIRSLAIHPTDPDQLLAGTASGQVFRSRDAGNSWDIAGEPVPFPGWVVSDLVFDPVTTSRVWAALRGVLGEEGFVALSLDGGANWHSRSERLPRRQVYAIAVAPERLYAATRVGVWGSRDDGETWQHLTAAHPEIQKVTSLLVDPAIPGRVFAGTWRRAYRSDDSGATWRGVFDGMILDSEVFSLHAAPDRNGEIWASTCGWVYRSLESGESWNRFSNGLEERRTPSFQVLADGVRLAGTVGGVYRTEDGGVSWQRVTPDDLVALAIEHHPSRPDRVFVGSEGAGVWRSLDGGKTFRPASRGLNAARIASLTALDGEVLAAVRHAGPASGIYSSFDGGRTYPLGPVQLPTVVELANDGQSVFAGTDAGLWERRGDSWRHVELLGTSPVRQIASAGESILVRTDDGVFVRRSLGEEFERVPFGRGEIASAAIDGEAVWISSVGGGLFRLVGDELVASAKPVQGGRLHTAVGQLLIADAGELWTRSGLGAAWKELGRPLSFLPTSDPDHPLLLVGEGGEARLLGGSNGQDRRFDLTLPAGDLSAALVRENRIVLGTSGFGLFVADLDSRADGEERSELESAR